MQKQNNNFRPEGAIQSEDKKRSKIVWIIRIVAIIIIGALVIWILSSMVSTDVRNTSTDHSIMSSFSNLRTSAEIYRDENNKSYEGFENDPSVIMTLEGMSEMSPGTAQCDSSDDAYRCYVELIEESLQGGSLYYCIDSTLTVKETTTNPANAPGYECP